MFEDRDERQQALEFFSGAVVGFFFGCSVAFLVAGAVWRFVK